MKQFDIALTRLNPFQRQAVETIEGPVMVIAGPGTGKTEVLTLRIAKILASTQMNPENILALTFTDAAVHEMRQRLISLIGNEAYRLSIYTFHSFCNHVIQLFEEEFENVNSEKSIRDLEQIQIIEDLLRNNQYKFLKPLSDPLMHAKSIVMTLNELKRESVDADRLLASIAADEEEFNKADGKYHEKGRYKGKLKGEFQKWEKRLLKNKELADIFNKYEQTLQQNNQFDFNDMILKVVRLLEKNQDVLQQLQEKYQYILVDEHQDTNTSQNLLIEQISSYHDNPNLFIVGDEKQAIFRFQGASLENFLYFKEHYPSALLINLQENYRSSQTILDASHSMIAHSAIPLPSLSTQLQAKSKRENKPIHLAVLQNYFAEYAYVAEDIRKKSGARVPLSKIAAICRTNRDLFELAHVLEQKQIPFIIDNDQNILEDIHIEKLFLLLKTISIFPSDELLVKTMHLDFLEINPLDIYRVTVLARDSKQPIWEILSKLDQTKIELEEKGKLITFFSQMKDWKKTAGNFRLDDAIVHILNESGFIKYALRRQNSFDIFDKLTRLFQEIRVHVYEKADFNLEEFLNYIQLLRTHHLQLKAKHITASQEAVQLITAHKAKGREFDYVYVLNVFDGHWGSRSKAKLFAIPWEQLGISRTPTGEDSLIEDERRLFYVALTRARHGITLTYAKQGIDGKEQVQSQFISEIKPEYVSIKDTDLFSDQFELNKQEIFMLPFERSVKDIFFAHKPYFLERLKRIGLSVTALNNYIACPWKYFFRNLVLLPEEKSVFQLYGTAIHNALNCYLEARKKKSESFELLISEFNKALEQQPLLIAEIDEWKERGVKALTGYFQERINTWKDSMESELTIPGINYKDNLFLSGKIDMIDIISTKNEVVVYDFKTGKPKSRNYIEGKVGKSHGDYKRQLVFYKKLLDNYRNGFYIMTGGVIEFVEPTESNTYKSEFFEITPEDTAQLETEIDTFYSEMQTLSFWDRTCDDPNCEYCQLRKFMSDELPEQDASSIIN